MEFPHRLFAALIEAQHPSHSPPEPPPHVSHPCAYFWCRSAACLSAFAGQPIIQLQPPTIRGSRVNGQHGESSPPWIPERAQGSPPCSSCPFRTGHAEFTMPSNTSQGTRSASPPSSRRDQVVTMARRQDKAIEAHAFAGSVAVAGSVTETNAPERKDGADHNSHQGSEYINAPGWLITTQHPSHHFQHHPDSDSPAYLHGELLRRGEPDYRPGPEQHTRMPDDTSPPSYLFHQTLAKKTPSFSHRHHPHQHASEQVSASPYATSSGDRSRSHGSPTSPTGSVDHSRSSRAGSRGLDLATTTAAEHRSEPSGPQTSTEAQSPNRRRTRVLMTRVQSEALNRLWSQVRKGALYTLANGADYVSINKRERNISTADWIDGSPSASLVPGKFCATFHLLVSADTVYRISAKSAAESVRPTTPFNRNIRQIWYLTLWGGHPLRCQATAHRHA